MSRPAIPVTTAVTADVASGTASLRHYLRDVTRVLSWRVLQVVGVTLLIAVSEGIGLVLLAPLLQLTGLELGAGPVGRVAAIVERVFVALGLPTNLGTILVAYVVIVALRALFHRWGALSNFRMRQRFTAQLRENLHDSLVRAEWLFFVRRRGTDFMHELTRELETVAIATFGLLQWAATGVLTAVYLAMALYLSPQVTLLVLFAGGILTTLLRLEVSTAKVRGARLSNAFSDFYATIGDHFTGMKTAKSHGIEDDYRHRFGQAAQAVEAAQVDIIGNQRTVQFWFQIGGTIILAVAIFVSVDTLGMSAANVLLLLYLFARLMPMFSGLQSGYQSMLASTAAYHNVKSLERAADAAGESFESGGQRHPLEHDIVLEDVTFSYEPGTLEPVLKGATMRIGAGQTVAIVGSSGAGKSTAADLLVGLLTPTSGRLLVDDEPLVGQRLQRWRRGLGYVAQDTYLFNDTVRANLRLTNSDADDEEIGAALKAASAEFVWRLPAGLDTLLGDRGVRLSGGERQRLALARALLRKPTLLVLDEATSSLDAENERQIQAAVDALKGRMAIVTIAHRLSTIRNADVIFVLDEGRLIESGTWEQLLAEAESRFRALCLAQGIVADENAVFG